MTKNEQKFGLKMGSYLKKIGKKFG